MKKLCVVLLLALALGFNLGAAKIKKVGVHPKVITVADNRYTISEFENSSGSDAVGRVAAVQTIADAVSLLDGRGGIIQVENETPVDADLTVPSNVMLILPPTAVFNVASTKTLTLNCQVQGVVTNTGSGTVAYGSSYSSPTSFPGPTHEYYVDGGRTDSYTADGSITRPYSTIKLAVDAVNADVLVHAAAGTGAAANYVVHVGAGTYTDNLTITGPRFLRIKGAGVVISGTIAINSGVGSYDHIEFVGQETGFSEKGPAMTLSGAITCTRSNDSLIYVSFKGCLISGALATVTDGTWVLQYDGCRVNGTITGTFSAAGHPQILLITNGWNEFAAAISGKLAFYDANGSDFYGAINTTPYYASKFRHCSFNSTVSIVPVSPADSSTQYLDLISYKSLLARTPTLTGASLSILETFGAGAAAATGNTALEFNSGNIHSTTLNLSNVDIAPAAAAGGVAFGNVKLYDFPAGHVYLIGTVVDLALTDATVTGAEMAGNFATWTPAGNWAYASDKWSHTTGDATALTTDVAAVAGTTYTVSVTMATSTAGGGLVVAMGGVTQSEVHGTETVSFTFTASATTALTFTPASGTWVGDITAVSVKTVTPISATWDGDIAFGTAADADGSLAGTEVNVVPSTATPQAVAAAATGDCQSTATEIAILDGHSTALDLYLNLLIDADDFIDAGTGALHLNGTVTVTWINLGDN